ncbi:MogA/MoaB family molybdenum cofactor biosynthesis protein [Bilophila wadsworthia]|uniref:MogA/MoaB family molybdenum cofactor biosynthesis protein n=1 Tax=Bilophila wadsworthia TaxID=35833 RepID=UPI001D0B9B11|nr:MogA/MoaB family molybdenum cofactor biosynthesis protein [Bilophila wadsworthia]MCB8570946.1 MogA/MoaB family molybdenum cofactor biosynthesis protein [Bilophila wadsworthia]MCC2715928.1 MogA/MoaB family molybdenum cofactor biosynthesis protein [Bilophila wadsworthia]
MTETIYTLSLHACAEGDILPLAFLPATAAPAPFAVHGMAARPLPDGNRDWRVGTCLYDASGVARLKVTGRMFLPPSSLALDAPHTQICPLLEALTPIEAGTRTLAARREHWALAWITLSDKGAAGLRVDESGPLMAADTRAKLPLCHEQGFMIPDDPQTLRSLVMELALGQGYDLILTSGGTGLAPRDTTPEALLPIFERRLPGFEQAMMQGSLAKTPTAAISRAVAGTLGRTIVITLPGSRKAVSENLAAILPALGHALEKLHGDPSDCGKRA